MKNTLFILTLFFAISASAQKFRGTDKSPLDMAYYPDNFNHDRKFAPKPEWNDKALIRIIYSRPAQKEREILGKLIPFGEVWRMGANESAEIKFYQNATIMGKKLKAGTYSLFGLATANGITFIFNKELDQFGAYSYKPELDVMRVEVPFTKLDDAVENFSIQFKQADDKVKNGVMMLAWGNLKAELPISF